MSPFFMIQSLIPSGHKCEEKKPAAQCLLRKYTFRTMIFMCWYQKVCKPVYRVIHDIVSRIHEFPKITNILFGFFFNSSQSYLRKLKFRELFKWQNLWNSEAMSWRAYKYVTVVWHCDIILWQCVKKPDKIMIYYTLVVLFTVIIIYLTFIVPFIEIEKILPIAFFLPK